MAITLEQIWSAADALDAAGEKPTLDTVRDAIGGGSYTTISKAMGMWRARKAEKSTPLREPLPAAISERLQELGSELWAAALELANGRLSSERALLEVARTELETSREEAAQLADRLAEDLQNAKVREQSLQHAESQLRAQVDELKQSLAAESSSARALGKDLEHLRSVTEQAREQEIVRREEIAGLRGQLNTLQEQNTQLLKRLPSVGT